MSDHNAPLVAIVVRPNVGKSTLFNRLVGGRPALVEDVPGVTRDRRYGNADFGGVHFRVVDTGGMDPTAAPGALTEGVHRQARQAIGEGVHRPFGAAHRGNRLRRHHVEPGSARLLRHLEQQGLVAEFDGIDMAVAVAIPELELRAAFGDDRDRRRTMQRLRSLRRRRVRTAQIRRLGQRRSGKQAEACDSDASGACQYGHGSFPFGVGGNTCKW
jgi:hypothetical protein